PQRPRRLVAEERARRYGRRPERAHAEAEEREWMLRHAERRHDVAEQPVRVSKKRRHHPAVRPTLASQVPAGPLERAPEQHRWTIVERMRHRRGGTNPLEAVLPQWQRAKERGEDAHRVRARADVVQEPG